MTELIWDGKYKDNKKVSPVRIALPFQTIETVNESVQERQKMLDLFSSGRDPEWRNRLIWGDKKYVLPSLLPEFAGKVNLIYIDPPFDTGADFSFSAIVPDNPETKEDETTNFIKEPSIIEQKAYRDTWGRGLDSYLQWFYETVVLFHELLHENGTIYVHLDWHVAHYAKVVLDEVFGENNFLNHIIWKRQTSSGFKGKNLMGKNHDDIFVYSKSDKFIYNPEYIPYSKEYIEQRFIHKEEETGRRFKDAFLGTATTKETIERLKSENKIYYTNKGGMRLKIYLDEAPGIPLDDVWTDINFINSMAQERVDYPTQKPTILLDRIISASSNESDLIFDCFVGSGTTAGVAEKLGRRWITCDLGRFAIHTTRKRLLSIPNVRPFVVQNLGKYERQSWQVAEFSNTQDQTRKELNYRKFILDLYKANMIKGYSWLHGIKNGRMVYVGSVDAPVTLADVKSISAEVWKSVGKGKDSPGQAAVDILGWDFALEVNEVAKQIAAESKVEVTLKMIPREVLEKKAVEQGDIKFFELASLSVKIEKKAMEAKVALSDFVIPPQDVPEEVQKAITHWSQWIDYWAIDWDYKNDTFHNQWQSYRTRKNSKIELEAIHVYEKPDEYKIAVKVIDILGNDTTKLMNIQVKSAPNKIPQKEKASRR